jgi:hypothetical protein
LAIRFYDKALRLYPEVANAVALRQSAVTKLDAAQNWKRKGDII